MDDYKATIQKLMEQVHELRAENLKLNADMGTFKKDHELQIGQFDVLRKKNEDLVMENLTLKDILYEKERARPPSLEANKYSRPPYVRSGSPLRTAASKSIQEENKASNLKSPTRTQMTEPDVLPRYEVIKHKTVNAHEDGPPLRALYQNSKHSGYHALRKDSFSPLRYK